MHGWLYSIAFLLAAYALGRGNFVLFAIMAGTFMHSLVVSFILQRYPSPLAKRELIWRIKRNLRYTSEDVAYFLRTKHRFKMLIHRFWGVVFYLEAVLLNSLIAHRRKIKDFRGAMRYHRLQVKLEKLRKAIYKQCERWREFDEISMQHASEEYYE